MNGYQVYVLVHNTTFPHGVYQNQSVSCALHTYIMEVPSIRSGATHRPRPPICLHHQPHTTPAWAVAHGICRAYVALYLDTRACSSMQSLRMPAMHKPCAAPAQQERPATKHDHPQQWVVLHSPDFHVGNPALAYTQLPGVTHDLRGYYKKPRRNARQMFRPGGVSCTASWDALPPSPGTEAVAGGRLLWLLPGLGVVCVLLS
jgi:hypothetical protein